MERYRRKESDACYVFFQRPQVPMGMKAKLEEGERKEERREESPFFYAGFERVLRARPHAAVERGSYRPVAIRFLPPDIRKRYSPDIILNIEAEEEEFLHALLGMYMRFFMKEVFIEHFTAINFARYRTIRRITENIDRKLEQYTRLQNKLRQEKINKEIEDIVLSHMAEEEKRERDFIQRELILRVDFRLPDEVVSRVREKLGKLGFPVRRVERANLIAGFQLLDQGRILDLSVEGMLRHLRLSAGRSISGAVHRNPRGS